jgi:hypothetical protein
MKRKGKQKLLQEDLKYVRLLIPVSKISFYKNLVRELRMKWRDEERAKKETLNQ